MRKVIEIRSTPKTKKRTRVAAYCRVSTQKDNQKQSFEAQQAYFAKKYKNSDNEELVEVYADAASGTSSLYRPGFQKMIADCQAGLIDRIVTKSISRFGRNIKECLGTLRELKRIGVTVHFEKEGIDTANVSDEIMITIMEGLAQEEAASISRNVRWSLKRKMANGTLGIARVPYGYRKVEGALVIEERQAEVVRRIFALYLSGSGAKKIASQLNSESIPSPTGTKWNNVTILKILRQEKYIGDIHWQKTYSNFMGAKWQINHGEQDSYYIRDCLPAIISREDFVIAQELRAYNTRQPSKTAVSPFRGKTKCICGRSYSLKEGYRSIWECGGRYDLVRPCGCKSFEDRTYNSAWKRLCKKLKLFAYELIVPAIEFFEGVGEMSVGNELSDIQEQAKELSNRKCVLCSLCSEGYITPEKMIEVQNHIDKEFDVIKEKAKKLEDQMDHILDDLSDLYNIATSFPVERFSEMVLNKAVTDGKTIEFELLGGLKFMEELE